MRSTCFLAVTLAIAFMAMTLLPAAGASASEAYPEGTSTIKHATRICEAYEKAGARHLRHFWRARSFLIWFAKLSDSEGQLFRKGSSHLKALDWPPADEARVTGWLARLNTQASLLDKRGRGYRVISWLIREKRHDLRTPRQLHRRYESNNRWIGRIGKLLKRNARLAGRAAASLVSHTRTGRRFYEACVRVSQRYL